MPYQCCKWAQFSYTYARKVVHTCVETKLYFPLFDEVMGYTGDPCIYIMPTGANHWIAVAIDFWYWTMQQNHNALGITEEFSVELVPALAFIIDFFYGRYPAVTNILALQGTL